MAAAPAGGDGTGGDRTGGDRDRTGGTGSSAWDTVRKLTRSAKKAFTAALGHKGTIREDIVAELHNASANYIASGEHKVRSRSYERFQIFHRAYTLTCVEDELNNARFIAMVMLYIVADYKGRTTAWSASSLAFRFAQTLSQHTGTTRYITDDITPKAICALSVFMDREEGALNFAEFFAAVIRNNANTSSIATMESVDFVDGGGLVAGVRKVVNQVSALQEALCIGAHLQADQLRGPIEILAGCLSDATRLPGA